MVGAGAKGGGERARGIGRGDDGRRLLIEDDCEDGLDHIGVFGHALREELVVVARDEVGVDVALSGEDGGEEIEVYCSSIFFLFFLTISPTETSIFVCLSSVHPMSCRLPDIGCTEDK